MLRDATTDNEPLIPYVNQCEVNPIKRAESKRLCDKLKTGILKSMKPL